LLWAGVAAFALVAGAGLAYWAISRRVDAELYRQPRGEVLAITPADLGLPYEDIAFPTRGGLLLRGWFVPGSPRAVVLAPGRGASRWQMLDYAPFLHRAGFALLLFDPRGRGESPGDTDAFGYYEAEDIQAAVAYLKAEKGAESIGVLGLSMGASAGLLAAARSEDIQAVVADSPYANLRLAAMTAEGNWRTRLFFPIYMWVAKHRLGFNVFAATNVLEVMAQAPPVLLIHGEGDELLSPENSRRLYQRAAGPRELWLVPGAGHGRALEVAGEEYVTRVVRFFRTYLQ